MHLTQTINSDNWRSYFDRFSKELGATEATVEIEGADLGSQIQAQDLLLTGISYDDRSDALIIGLDAPGGLPEDLEHLVYRPREIQVETQDLALPSTIQVEDAEGRRTRIRLRAVPVLGEN